MGCLIRLKIQKKKPGNANITLYATELFTQGNIAELQAELEEVYGLLALEVAENRMSAKAATEQLAQRVGSSFGMRNGMRDSFKEITASLAYGMAHILDDDFSVESLPDNFKSFTGKIATLPEQWYQFLLLQDVAEPQSEVYVKNNANILSLLLVYAHKLQKIDVGV